MDTLLTFVIGFFVTTDLQRCLSSPYLLNCFFFLLFIRHIEVLLKIHGYKLDGDKGMVLKIKDQVIMDNHFHIMSNHMHNLLSPAVLWYDAFLRLCQCITYLISKLNFT